MKTIELLITVNKLPEDGFIAYARDWDTDSSQCIKLEGDALTPIYGNTLIQIRQRIGKRLKKLIVEED